MASNMVGEPITIVLTGITGEGKSSTGNTLCGDPAAFKTSSRMKSETQNCSHWDFDYNGKKYRVIDPIGLQDTNLSTNELHQRFRAFADLAPHGVDAFLYVIKQGRFKPESAHAFDTFQEACTEAALKHTMIVVTSVEELSQQDFDHKDFLDSFFDDAKNIPNLERCVEQVRWHVVGVENKNGQELKDEGRKLILDMVEHIRRENGCQRYSNQHLHEAEQWRASIKGEAQQLESEKHSEVVMVELNECFHGRRTRAQVQAKVKELKDEEAILLAAKEAEKAAQQKAAQEAQARAEAERQTKEQQSKAEQERQRAEKAEKWARREAAAREQAERRLRKWQESDEFSVQASKMQEKSFKVEVGDCVEWSYELKKEHARTSPSKIFEIVNVPRLSNRFDVKFGISLQVEGSKDVDILRSSSRSCSEHSRGTINISSAGKLIFVFDNTYNIASPKIIRFKAENHP